LVTRKTADKNTKANDNVETSFALAA